MAMLGEHIGKRCSPRIVKILSAMRKAAERRRVKRSIADLVDQADVVGGWRSECLTGMALGTMVPLKHRFSSRHRVGIDRSPQHIDRRRNGQRLDVGGDRLNLLAGQLIPALHRLLDRILDLAGERCTSPVQA